MTADADLYWAYDYGGHIGKPASEVMNLPIDEIRGYIAYLKIKSDTRDSNA